MIKEKQIWLNSDLDHKPTPNNLDINYCSSVPFNPDSLFSYCPRRAANGSYAGAGWA